MTTTPVFKFRLTATNATEAAKIANANENALITEAFLKLRVQSKTTTVPPGSPTNGQVWIVPGTGVSPAPSGAWAGHENEIAIYYNGWIFAEPCAGPRFWVADEEVYVQFDEAVSPQAWTEIGGVNNAFHDNVSAEFNALTLKASPVDADIFVMEDSENSFSKVKVPKSAIGGGGGGIGNTAIVDKSSTQVITSATNTIITWNRDVLDDVGSHDPVTNNSRIVAWVTGNNWYRVKFCLHTDATSTLLRFQTWLALNRAGSTTFFNDFPRLQREMGRAAITGTNGFHIEIEAIIQLSLNDYIELGLWASQSGGTTLEADNTFAEIEHLGPV